MNDLAGNMRSVVEVTGVLSVKLAVNKVYISESGDGVPLRPTDRYATLYTAHAVTLKEAEVTKKEFLRRNPNLPEQELSFRWISTRIL